MAFLVRVFRHRWMDTVLEVIILLLALMGLLSQPTLHDLVGKTKVMVRPAISKWRTLDEMEEEFRRQERLTLMDVSETKMFEKDAESEDYSMSSEDRQAMSSHQMIVCVVAHMRQFFNSLESLRTSLMEQVQTWVSWQQDVELIRAAWPKYFDLIRQHSNVKTLFFNCTLEDMSKCLNHSFYYAYASSPGGCKELDGSVTDHKYNSKPVYSMQCTEDMAVANASKDVQESDLEVGLPLKIQQAESKIWTYIHVIRNALVNLDGNVISGGVKISLQNCDSAELDEAVYTPDKARTYPLYDEVLTIAVPQGSSLYHRNVDALSRLIPYLPFLKYHDRIKIHLTDRPALLQLIETHGISMDRVVRGTLRARILYTPQGMPCNRPAFFSTHLLKLYLTPPKTLLAEPRNFIILVRHTHGVQSKNLPAYAKIHKEILDMLQDFSYQLHLSVRVYDDTPYASLEDAELLYNRAMVVISPHRASQMLLMLCRPGTLLMEGLCGTSPVREDSFSMVYRNLMHVGALRYHAILPPSHSCEDIGAKLVQDALKLYFPQYKIN